MMAIKSRSGVFVSLVTMTCMVISAQSNVATAAELFWFAGTSGTYPTGGATWDTSNTNWSLTNPPTMTSPPADPWNLANGPTNIARFNIDNDVASISGTVYPSSIRFSGDDAVVNGPGVIGFATTTSTFTLRADAGKTGTINADFGTIGTAPTVSGQGNVLAKTNLGEAIITGNVFLLGDADVANTTGKLSVEGGGELNVTGFVKVRSSSQINRGDNIRSTAIGQTSANNILSLTGTSPAYTDVNGVQTGRLLMGALDIGASTFGGNSVIISSPGTATAPTVRQRLNGPGATGTFQLGVSSSSNSMEISNGAYFLSRGEGTGTWKIGVNAGANNNSLTVTGSGSTLDRSLSGGSAINVGEAGSSNSLLISAGGTVIPKRLVMGANGGDANYAQVSGNTSLLNFDPAVGAGALLQIGAVAGSSGNYLQIDSGGDANAILAFANSNFVGSGTGADNNYILVTGVGSTLSFRQNTPLSFGGTATGGTAVDSTASGNHFDIFSGATSSQNTLYLQGVNSAVNLGNGTGISELTVGHSTASTFYGAGVRLIKADSRLNVNSGRLIADVNSTSPTVVTDFVTGLGEVNLLGNGYFKTDQSTLRVISTVITGVGDFHKEGTGTLALTNTSLLTPNDYTGDTYVDAGVLRLDASFLDDLSSVFLYSAGSAKMNLNFAGMDTIGALYFDDVLQASGTWGRSGSGATHINDTFFNNFPLNNFGMGLLNVTGDDVPAVPEPSALALAALGLIGLGLAAWRRNRSAGPK
ncbi:MAG: PEP-CTERM sorting domain-containing protein [Planctomycetes bacterium]|nr:PEP-CTERM sorting domain-containing protein [Planctomycetota bacterium]